MKRICYDFAQHSFGIYLVHLLVMRKVLWPLIGPLNLHYAIQIPLVVILTAALSYFVVHLISFVMKTARRREYPFLLSVSLMEC